jgi:glycosyltransferase involved in cell wall biosynthesis
MRPKVSLIVCTRDRATRLPDFLARIRLLESPRCDWELILVDHASTDGTPDLIEAFATGAPFRVQHLRSMARALSGAKNEALARARGDILAFTDDDCYPRPDFLCALVDVFAEHLDGVVGGRVVLHDPSDAKFCLKDVDTPAEIQPASFVPAGTIHGANMAVTREVVSAIGGFDPMLGPGTACWTAAVVRTAAAADSPPHTSAVVAETTAL